MKKPIRITVFVDAGLVVDVISDSTTEIEYVVVDSDPTALDKSVLSLMKSGPFDDISCLVSTYGDSVYHNPEKVAEVFAVREDRFCGRNHHVL
jgi:hypothetical protein